MVAGNECTDLTSGPQAKLNTVAAVQRFLAKYGFRCINELKLEESTLHDDPGMCVGGKLCTFSLYCVKILSACMRCTCTVHHIELFFLSM